MHLGATRGRKSGSGRLDDAAQLEHSVRWFPARVLPKTPRKARRDPAGAIPPARSRGYRRADGCAPGPWRRESSRPPDRRCARLGAAHWPPPRPRAPAQAGNVPRRWQRRCRAQWIHEDAVPCVRGRRRWTRPRAPAIFSSFSCAPFLKPPAVHRGGLSAAARATTRLFGASPTAQRPVGDRNCASMKPSLFKSPSVIKHTAHNSEYSENARIPTCRYDSDHGAMTPLGLLLLLSCT